MDTVLARRRLPRTRSQVVAVAFDEGLLFVKVVDAEPGRMEVVATWDTCGGSWRSYPGAAGDEWSDWTREHVLSDELLERFWRLLHQTWEDELPSLLAAAAAPDADDEARDVVRRGSVYLTLARAGMGAYPPELTEVIMSLSNGWEQTGDQLVDAAEQLLKERPQ